MKFAIELERSQVAEWTTSYIDYARLKKLVYSAQNDLSSAHYNEKSIDEVALSIGDAFLCELDSELEKISAFFISTESTAIASLNELRTELRSINRSPGLSARLSDCFLLFSNLKRYIELNHTGFSKILKKFDKNINLNLRFKYLTLISNNYAFKSSTMESIILRLAQIKRLYSIINPEQQLLPPKSTDRTVLTRDSVWKCVHSDLNHPIDEELVPLLENAPANSSKCFYFPFFVCFVTLLLVLITWAFVPPTQAPCAAVLVVACVFWASHVIPLYSTALLVPVLLVLTGALRDPTTHAAPSHAEAASALFSAMFASPVVMVLGGFSMAAALSKHGVANICAIYVLKRAGTTPSNVLLAVMLISFVLSVIISNIAAPVLCFALIQPILRTLPVQASPIAKSLVIGIAIASNIGGMGSPIASPQNIFGIDNMLSNFGWIKWLLVSTPVCIISILASWGIIISFYQPNKAFRSIMPIPASGNECFSFKQYFVVFVCVFTVFLWCTEFSFASIFGNSGIIALLPLIAFTSFGILDKDDINSFLWTVILLAMGGIALGRAVTWSGVLKIAAKSLTNSLLGLSTWVSLFIITFFILIIASVISHTVSALILLPLVKEIGIFYHQQSLMVFSAALACSAAMALPISGFPNICASSQEDSQGRAYLDSKDFIKIGIPCSISTLLVILTVGFLIMNMLSV